MLSIDVLSWMYDRARLMLPTMHRFVFVFASLISSACTVAHGPGDAGGVRDAVVAPPDASPDAGRRLTRCLPEASDPVGEACFCEGPIARHGDIVYRQAIGVEVWDVSDPSAPLAVGVPLELRASQGGLAVTSGHLLAVGNFEPAFTVYSLEDPSSPRRVAELPLGEPAPRTVVARGDFAVVAAPTFTPEGSTDLVGVDLARFDAPREHYRVSVEGQVSSAAIDGARLYAVVGTDRPRQIWLAVHELRTGAQIARHLIAEGDTTFASNTGLGVLRGRVLLGVGSELRVLEVGVEMTEVGRLTLDDVFVGGIVAEGNLAVAGGSAGFHAIDVSDPRAPRLLASRETAGGRHLLLDEARQLAFASTNFGLTALRLNCE